MCGIAGFSRDPARPIDVRVLSVKIAFGGPTPLKLGQRVEVQIMEGPPNGAAKLDLGLNCPEKTTGRLKGNVPPGDAGR